IREDKGKVTIKVPGSHHDLYRKKLNAPRVLQEVEGDFVAQVKVTADWKPGARLPETSTVPYNGAGLLVWDSAKHYVRWERNVLMQRTTASSYVGPLHWKDGSETRPKVSREEFFKGRSTWLRVERASDKLTTYVSHDGKQWMETGALTPAFPKTVRVGIVAIHNTAAELVVEFEEFKVSKK